MSGPLSEERSSASVPSLRIRRSVAAAWLASMCVCTAGFGCAEPLQEETIASLGPEVDGIPEGPLHRAGQPCLVCHDGGEASELAVAGTIYERADSKKSLSDVLVHLVDARGTTYATATNCAGNFFVRPGDYRPEYPMWVAIERDGFRQEMESPVNGDGSCAGCHTSKPGPRSAGHVYLLSLAATLEEHCP